MTEKQKKKEEEKKKKEQEETKRKETNKTIFDHVIDAVTGGWF